MTDTITIRAFTRSGYPKSVNLKVYGTFTFRGLEESVLAGSHNLMDLMTFRDLYGVMTDERRAELAVGRSQQVLGPGAVPSERRAGQSGRLDVADDEGGRSAGGCCHLGPASACASGGSSSPSAC